MEEKRRVRKIIERTNCTYDQALEADRRTKGDVDEAVEYLKKKGNELYVGGGSSGLAVDSGPRQDVIVGYSNGLLVNDKFYDYADPSNLRLKEMLKNNEFDREVLGYKEDEEMAEVTYKDYTNLEYSSPKKEAQQVKKTYEDNKKHSLNLQEERLTVNCPDEIVLDEQGDCVFKVMADNKRVTVRMNGSMCVDDFYKELKKYCDKDVVLTKRGSLVVKDSTAQDLKNNMFMLNKK